jgi:hypothetical protein
MPCVVAMTFLFLFGFNTPQLAALNGCQPIRQKDGGCTKRKIRGHDKKRKVIPECFNRESEKTD